MIKTFHLNKSQEVLSFPFDFTVPIICVATNLVYHLGKTSSLCGNFISHNILLTFENLRQGCLISIKFYNTSFVRFLNMYVH